MWKYFVVFFLYLITIGFGWFAMWFYLLFLKMCNTGHQLTSLIRLSGVVIIELIVIGFLVRTRKGGCFT